jgi:TetR/AcrR family fatty acid metabolism transcriptional regulator
VAKAAGVADGTIYNYFENKTALLLGILDPLNDRERITELPPFELPSDPRDFFRHFFARRWLAFSGQNLPALRVLLSEVLVNPKLCVPFVERVVAPTIQLAEPVFQRYVDAGTLRPIDLSLALRALVGTFLGLLLLRLMGDKAVEDAWADLPDLLATLLLDGLLPD